MTPDELARAQCMVCGGPSREWCEVYVCSHDTGNVRGALVAKCVLCTRCRTINFGLSATEQPGTPLPEKPS